MQSATWFTPNRILAIAFAVFLIYGFPGYVSIDSLQQLEESRAHAFGDWHPPAMAALWAIVEIVVAGPAGMFVLQGGLLLLGLYALLRRGVSDRRAAIAAGVIVLCPPVLTTMGVIWKDSMMAGMFAAGAALMLSDRRPIRVLAAAVLVLAMAMRANAPIATLPLFVAFTVRGGSRGKRIVLGALAWLAATGAALALTAVLTRVPQHAWSRSLGPGDITGIIRYTHGRYSDAELRQILAGTPLMVTSGIEAQARRAYHPESWWPASNGPQRVFDWPVDEPQRTAIGRAWRTLVIDAPDAYARHRWRVFREVLGLSKSPPFDPAWQVHLPSPTLHLDASSGVLQKAFARATAWVAFHTPLFRPCIYLFAALILLVLARRHPDLVALLASGLLYELTLLPFAPSADFRYSHWMVTTTIVAGVAYALRSLDANADDPARHPADEHGGADDRDRRR